MPPISWNTESPGVRGGIGVLDSTRHSRALSTFRSHSRGTSCALRAEPKARPLAAAHQRVQLNPQSSLRTTVGQHHKGLEDRFYFFYVMILDICLHSPPLHMFCVEFIRNRSCLQPQGSGVPVLMYICKSSQLSLEAE